GNDGARLDEIAIRAITHKATGLLRLGIVAGVALATVRLFLEHEEERVLVSTISLLEVDEIPVATLLHVVSEPDVAHIPAMIGVGALLTDLRILVFVWKIEH